MNKIKCVKAIEILELATAYALRCYYDDTVKLYEELIKLNVLQSTIV